MRSALKATVHGSDIKMLCRVIQIAIALIQGEKDRLQEIVAFHIAQKKNCIAIMKDSSFNWENNVFQ